MQPNMEELIAYGVDLQQQMRTAQDDLARERVTGRSADGTVAVVVTGMGAVQSVEVDPAVFDSRDTPALQTAILEAIRAAAANAGRRASRMMGDLEINLY